MSTSWEWHFATDDWQEQETTAISKNDPILLTITGGLDSDLPKNPEYFNIINYDKSRFEVFDFDISKCNKDVENKHIRFEIKRNQKKRRFCLFINYVFL